ncbi:MAG: HAD family hydrolase [Elusimicrobia bacterium]|nr:HAD family hydrolase [Elusimicrobiota bacterium]
MRAWPERVRRTAPRPTAFLDRDGTLNWDRPGFYVTGPGRLRLYAAAPEAVRLLNAKGYRVVVLTNQSAVGRGYMTMEASLAVNRKLVRELRRAGARVDAVYFCPHAPEAACSCRKPRTGLIDEAVKDCPADLPGSFMAGDKDSDLRMAANAGLKGYLVRTGHARSAKAPGSFRDLPALARALPAAAETRKRKRK